MPLPKSTSSVADNITLGAEDIVVPTALKDQVEVLLSSLAPAPSPELLEEIFEEIVGTMTPSPFSETNVTAEDFDDDNDVAAPATLLADLFSAGTLSISAPAEQPVSSGGAGMDELSLAGDENPPLAEDVGDSATAETEDDANAAQMSSSTSFTALLCPMLLLYARD